MAKRDAFSDHHPGVIFLYFALTLVCAMFLLHPVCLAISLTGAVCYAVSLRGWRALRLQLTFIVPMMLVTALVNALFNHRGNTVLAHLPGGSPLTLESLAYGAAAAVMLAAVVTWFYCYSAVMTSDKFVYLFGRVIPALSLVLSMALRFVPRFKNQLNAVTQAQRGVGRSVTQGRWTARLHSAVAIFSIMLTWSLENAVETTDSMKSRGYGLPGRSAFSIYRFDPRDKTCLLWLLSCGFYILCGWAGGGFAWRYFPALAAGALTPLTASFFAAYLALCLTPALVNAYAAKAWAATEGGAGSA